MPYFNVPFEVKQDDITEEGNFKGYGAVFGGKPDRKRDIIREGAFKNTLNAGGRNGTGVAMLWQHDSAKPIGIWNSLVENTRGLKVDGQLAVKGFVHPTYDVRQATEAYVLLKMRALQGLSIGWGFPQDDKGKIKDGSYTIDEKKRIRYVNEIELWEVSPVTFPAKLSATITQVKSIEDAKNERELEAILRESGLSKHAAQYLVGFCWPSLREAKEAGDVKNGIDDILAEIKNINASIRVAKELHL